MYSRLLVTPDGRKLYAISEADSSITVYGVADLQRKRTFHLPKPYRSAFMARDGRRIYISSPEGGVMVVDTAADRVLEGVIPTGEPAFDIAVTPDNRKLFLAMGNAGLKRIDLKTGQSRVLSSLACPVHLDIDRSGKHLYVAYQCGGPGGREGHDAVDIYDVDTEQSIFVIKDLPMVGAHPIFAPHDEVALLPMRDACFSPAYDHAGCLLLPSVGFHLWRPGDRRVVWTQTFPLGGNGNNDFGEFFGLGTRILFPSRDALEVWDWARHLTVERLPLSNTSISSVVISPSDDRAFAAPGGSGGLLVLDAEPEACLPLRDGLTNFYPGDGTADDAQGEGSLTMAGGVDFAPGRMGQAFQFKGQNGFMQALEGSPFCTFCRASWAIAVFVKFQSLDGEMTLLNREDPQGTWDLTVFKRRDQHIAVTDRSSAAEHFVASAAPVEVGRWYHIAVVTDKDSRSLFLDGVLQERHAVAAKIDDRESRDSNGRWFLGATQGQRNFFHGLMDEIAVYGRALRPEEVETLTRGCTAGQ